MDSQMKKGVLEMCLLQLIANRECYGYSLMSEVTAAFPGVSESTVYAILRRIQSEGLAVSYTGEQSGGPVRKYYRLTGLGKAALEAAQTDWRALCAAVEGLGISRER